MEKTIIPGKRIELRAAPGHRITTWKEGDPIADYEGKFNIDAPLNADVSKFREITEEQHEQYQHMKEETLKKFEAMNPEIME